jgi:hypothetical protein
MRAARSRTSGEKRLDFLLLMAPSSQSKEPPQWPGRFTLCGGGTASAAGTAFLEDSAFLEVAGLGACCLAAKPLDVAKRDTKAFEFWTFVRPTLTIISIFICFYSSFNLSSPLLII